MPDEVERCPATGKVVHRTWAAARRAVLAKTTLDEVCGRERRLLRAFPCRLCSGFHLGRPLVPVLRNLACERSRRRAGLTNDSSEGE